MEPHFADNCRSLTEKLHALREPDDLCFALLAGTAVSDFADHTDENMNKAQENRERESRDGKMARETREGRGRDGRTAQGNPENRNRDGKMAREIREGRSRDEKAERKDRVHRGVRMEMAEKRPRHG